MADYKLYPFEGRNLMADYDGDPKLKPASCKDVMRCENMKEYGVSMDGERYKCEKCGAHYYLDYEEMK